MDGGELVLKGAQKGDAAAGSGGTFWPQIECKKCKKIREMPPEEFAKLTDMQWDCSMAQAWQPGASCRDREQLTPGRPHEPPGFHWMAKVRKQSDIFYVTPDKKKLYSTSQMSQYLAARGQMGLDASKDFCFSVPVFKRLHGLAGKVTASAAAAAAVATAAVKSPPRSVAGVKQGGKTGKLEIGEPPGSGGKAAVSGSMKQMDEGMLQRVALAAMRIKSGHQQEGKIGGRMAAVSGDDGGIGRDVKGEKGGHQYADVNLTAAKKSEGRMSLQGVSTRDAHTANQQSKSRVQGESKGHDGGRQLRAEEGQLQMAKKPLNHKAFGAKETSEVQGTEVPATDGLQEEESRREALGPYSQNSAKQVERNPLDETARNGAVPARVDGVEWRKSRSERLAEDNEEDGEDRVPAVAKEYWLEKSNEDMVDIVQLTLLINNEAANEGSELEAILRGKDDGGGPVFREVDAWKIVVKMEGPILKVRDKARGKFIQLAKASLKYRQQGRKALAVGWGWHAMKFYANKPVERLGRILEERNVPLSLVQSQRRLLGCIAKQRPELKASTLWRFVSRGEREGGDRSRRAAGTRDYAPGSSGGELSLGRRERFNAGAKGGEGGREVGGKRRRIEQDDDEFDVAAAFLDAKRRKREMREEDEAFIAEEDDDDDDGYEEGEEEIGTEMEGGEESAEEDDVLGDNICFVCDDGGELLCCDGPCMRSFHAYKAAAQDSHCPSLGFPREAVQKMQSFLCLDCELKRHQCFICFKPGSSDESFPETQEVFKCDVALCGHFYHPACVATWQVQRDAQKYGQEEKIVEGIRSRTETFFCPLHSCDHCHEPVVQFGDKGSRKSVPCRRCPRVYHAECLPNTLVCMPSSDPNQPQRVWGVAEGDALQPLMYCPDHEVEPSLGTPARTQCAFLDEEEWRERLRNVAVGRDERRDRLRRKRALLVDDEEEGEEGEQGDGAAEADKGEDVEVDIEGTWEDEVMAAADLGTKTKEAVGDVAGGAKERKDAELEKRSVPESSKRLFSSGGERLGSVDTTREQKRKKEVVLKRAGKEAADAGPLEQQIRGRGAADVALLPTLSKKKCVVRVADVTGKEADVDASTRERVTAFRDAARGLVTASTEMDQLLIPAIYQSGNKDGVVTNLAKRTPTSKVASLCAAKKHAEQILRENGPHARERAQMVFSSENETLLRKIHDSSKVYLAPFLHGRRYTSYGRHFTTTEKLRMIVDVLEPYVGDGDVIVDMCCGANEFSLLAREKLMKVGKSACGFRNFDIEPAPEKFNFELRDWTKVKVGDLPHGDRLIIGLNPPFGVEGRLAFQFALHALSFRPRLLILIAPPETRDLSSKGYVLLWRDSDICKGQSFYLPGAVHDKSDQMSQWNKESPPLSLWCRRDLLEDYVDLAIEAGHFVDRSNVGSEVRFEVFLAGKASDPDPDFDPESEQQGRGFEERSSQRSPTIRDTIETVDGSQSEWNDGLTSPSYGGMLGSTGMDGGFPHEEVVPPVPPNGNERNRTESHGRLEPFPPPSQLPIVEWENEGEAHQAHDEAYERHEVPLATTQSSFSGPFHQIEDTPPIRHIPCSDEQAYEGYPSISPSSTFPIMQNGASMVARGFVPLEHRPTRQAFVPNLPPGPPSFDAHETRHPMVPTTFHRVVTIERRVHAHHGTAYLQNDLEAQEPTTRVFPNPRDQDTQRFPTLSITTHWREHSSESNLYGGLHAPWYQRNLSTDMSAFNGLQAQQYQQRERPVAGLRPEYRSLIASRMPMQDDNRRFTNNLESSRFGHRFQSYPRGGHVRD